MRKIQQFVLKGKEIFVGLEDSKKTWKLCIRSGGVVVKEASMPANYETLQHFFHNNFPECTINVIYEAGFRGFGLHDQLTEDGWNCVVTPPHTVTQEKCTKQKNDRIDCRRLAKNLENNDYKACHVPDKQLREDRQISRSYGQMQRDIVRVCNRIRRSLEFHSLDNQFIPGAWKRVQYSQVGGMLDQLKLSAALRFSFKIMFDQLNALWNFRQEILVELRNLSTSDRYRDSVNILKSAPGIGPLTAIRLALEWGDVSRFKRKEEFASFTGLIPSDYSTGEQDHKGHITKQGNRGVRSWLIECSWVAIRKDPVLMEKYHAVWSHSGSKKKAIVAVARKLAIRLRALLLTKQYYAVGTLE